MSYCRFGSDSNVYVYTSSQGLECCACWLDTGEWVDQDFLGTTYKVFQSDGSVQTLFQSNRGMIEHLNLHVEKGHKVPDRALERLRDPEDAKENEEIWAKYNKKYDKST